MCVWLYCLLAFVEMPLSSGVCGTIRGIYRRLSEYSIDNEALQSCVDVVKVICSRYFNQKFWFVWETHVINWKNRDNKAQHIDKTALRKNMNYLIDGLIYS